MTEPRPGQSQLFAIEPTSKARWSAENLPRYEDVVLTAEQIDQAALEWPDKTPGQQVAYMRKRVHNKMLHEIIVDPTTGRRALGGPQRGTAGKEKKRLDEMMVEEAENRSREITDALFSALERGVDPAVRHKAAINIMREARAVHEQNQKDDELERASKEEIMDLAVDLLARAVRSGDLSPTDFNLTEADVIELEEG